MRPKIIAPPPRCGAGGRARLTGSYHRRDAPSTIDHRRVAGAAAILEARTLRSDRSDETGLDEMRTKTKPARL